MNVNGFISILETVSLVLAVGALIVLIYFIVSRAVKHQGQR